MARIFDVSRGAFDSTYRRYAPANKVQRIGRKVLLHARSLLEVWADNRNPSHHRHDNGAGGGGALEEFRRERAKISELERKEREKSLLRRDVVHDKLQEFAGILRSAGDMLQRKYGPEAQEILEQAVTEFERRVEDAGL